MKVIRRNIFETNSSSVHSLTIVSKEDYEKWKNGELVYDTWAEELVSSDEVEYPEESKTYEEYWENNYLETFKQEYTTKNGEAIVAFGYFGYDG